MNLKKITAFVMALALVFTAGFTVVAQDVSQSYGWHYTLFGDLTLDGIVGAVDALEVLKLVVGKLQNDRMLPAADTDRDGTVGAADALDILKYTVGKTTRLDAPQQVTIHMWSQWQRVGTASNGNGHRYSRDCRYCNASEEKVMKQPPAAITYEDMQQEVLRLVNAVRISAGESPLVYYAAGQNSANIRANECNTLFSHTRPNGSDYSTVIGSSVPWYRLGENIAMGQTSPAQVVEDWMNSTGHRNNILHPDHTHLIVGVVPCEQQGYSGYCWVQLFIGM